MAMGRITYTLYLITADFIEGTASLMVGYAISRADLIVIPTQGSLLDAAEAVKAIRLVRQYGETAGKIIPTAILFTRASAADGLPTRSSPSLAWEPPKQSRAERALSRQR